jgi:hypothetical protein
MDSYIAGNQGLIKVSEGVKFPLLFSRRGGPSNKPYLKINFNLGPGWFGLSSILFFNMPFLQHLFNFLKINIFRF